MELEEMQAAWSQMSQDLEKQKQLTDEIILKMTQQRYKNHWNKIAIPEKIGGVICYTALVLILINFEKFDTLPLQISGAFMAIILAILPILSLYTIYNLQRINPTKTNYKKTMEAYAKRKKDFVNFQKLNIGISFIFMLVTIPVSAKLFSNKDLFANFNDKLFYILPFMLLFFAGLIWFVTRCYKGILRNSERILEEIKD